MDFTERTQLEAGFSGLFRSTVRPALLALETERRQRLARARKSAGVAIVGSLAVAGGVLALFSSGGWAAPVAFMILALGVVVAVAALKEQATGWNGAIENAVMPSVCKHVGDLDYSGGGGQRFPFAEMLSLGVLASYTKANLSGELTGRHWGTAFELVEAHLTKRTRSTKGGSRTTTVFHGLVLHVDVPVEAPTSILITRDYGAIGNRLGTLFTGGKRKGMPRVQLPHPEFEAAFEVHADDPQAAIGFLPDLFLDNLLTIGETEGGPRGAKSMAAGFRGTSFYLALNRGDGFLKMGSITTPVADMENDLHAIFADIEMVHRIIDRLHGT